MGLPPDRSGDELGSEFTTNAPHQTALPGISGREDQSEFGRGIEMLGDDFHTTVRNVGDHAVARQGAVPDLDFRETSAQATRASTTIGSQHVDLIPRPYRSIGSSLDLQRKRSNRPIGINRNRRIEFDLILAIRQPQNVHVTFLPGSRRLCTSQTHCPGSALV